eukprot:TRINITY_DN1034_c0_g1_i1.p1 TRINITY_DN1034_c0_g1~~TRINITY_DN1034_c0_g1_i1.p1  ORF type:complete len:596 (-),score=64.84 TRINITY_DN1034_c0_g1_i1:113-1684(-)
MPSISPIPEPIPEEPVSAQYWDLLPQSEYVALQSRLWSTHQTVPSTSHCSFRIPELVIKEKGTKHICPAAAGVSSYTDGILHLSAEEDTVFKVTKVDRDPWVHPEEPKFHEMRPRDWKLHRGQDKVVLNSDYVAVHSEQEELLDVHVDLIPKPRNETEIKALEERKSAGWGLPNIVMFSIDSISRGHFNLAMPLTASYLRDLNLGDTHRSFLFNRLNGMSGQTAANLTPQLSGQFYYQDKLNEERWRTATYRNPEVKHDDWIWNWAKKQGYVTMLGVDICGEMFGTTQWDKLGIDHIAPVISEDCHYVYQQETNLGQGKCIAGKLLHEYYQEYTLKFLKKYENIPKFSFVHYGEGHVNQPWAVNILDESSHTFVKKILEEPNTILIVSSDHGKGNSHRAPLFSLTLPIPYLTKKHNLQGELGPEPKLGTEQSKFNGVSDLERNLFLNQQELISWFDVYRTLKHLAAYPVRFSSVFDNPSARAPQAQSLLSYIPETRSCSDIGVMLVSIGGIRNWELGMRNEEQ